MKFIHTKGDTEMAERPNEETRTKRELILAAARDLFVKKGYEETTIADIAQAASIAVGTVYLYFRNKHEVYTGAALDVGAMIVNSFYTPSLLDLPFEQIPAAMAKAVFRVCHEHQNLMSLLQVDKQSSEEILLHKKSEERITQAIDAVLRHAVERGELAPFNTEMYAQILSLSAGAIFHQCFAIEKGEREELYLQYLTEFVERLFFGPSLREGKKEPEHS
jgi:AcrR family transcriptional regulator